MRSYEDLPRDRFGSLVGAGLIAEGLLVAIVRLLALVYALANEANVSDEAKAPARSFLPWLLVSAAIITVLLWAGVQLRRQPDGAWSVARTIGRLVLIAAALLNIVVAVRAVTALTSSNDLRAEAGVAWIAVLAVAATILVGMLRDAAILHRRARGS